MDPAREREVALLLSGGSNERQRVLGYDKLADEIEEPVDLVLLDLQDAGACPGVFLAADRIAPRG